MRAEMGASALRKIVPVHLAAALLFSVMSIPIAIEGKSILLSTEESEKFAVLQWHFDSKLRRDIGIIVSRIIVENVTAHSVQGYLADSGGNRLWMVDDVQVVLAKFVFNNTASTEWELADWVRDGYFAVDRSEYPEAVALRIYIGPNSYSIDNGPPGILQSWVFINPAWTEFPLFSNDKVAKNLSVAGSTSQNPYDPRTYKPVHCTYLVDLYSVYDQCAKLYILEDKKTAGAGNGTPALEPVETSPNPATSPSEDLPVPHQAPVAADVAERLPELQCQMISGMTFGIGDNPMSCTVDDAGKTEVRSLDIRIIDTAEEPDDVTDDQVYFTGQATTTYTISINATDLMDPSLSITCYMPEREILSGEFIPLRLSAMDCEWSDSVSEPAETNLFIVRTYSENFG
jgi:hypothetical protein